VGERHGTHAVGEALQEVLPAVAGGVQHVRSSCISLMICSTTASRRFSRPGNVFAYIDVRDLGQVVQRCLETDGLGYEVFNVGR
jgi:hypothetical protein